MTQSWKVILAFCGIFAAGAVTGGSVSYYWIRSHRPAPPPQGPRISIEQFVRNQQELMTKKLRLTAEQNATITPILNQASQDLRKLHEENSRATEKLIQSQDSEILSHLTPEQQKKFEQFRKDQRERFEQNRKERAERARKQAPSNGAQHGRRMNEEPAPQPPPPPPAGEAHEKAPLPEPSQPAPQP